MLSLITLTLVAAAAATVATEPTGLIETSSLLGSPTNVDTPSKSDEADEFEVGAEEKRSGITARAADLSGCGVHRTCTACRDQNARGACYWNPGTGCVKSWMPSLVSQCTAQNNQAPKCSAFQDCNSCTLQNGCVFYRGQCTYSRGTNCENDPDNCVNYPWTCPATPIPVYVQPQAPVQVQTPDRISETVSRVEDMIIGMSAAELRRLRTKIEAVLIAAETAAFNPALYATPYASPYAYSAPAYAAPAAGSLNSQLFGLDWATTASYSTNPSAYPAIFAAKQPSYTTPAKPTYLPTEMPSYYNQFAAPTYNNGYPSNNGYQASYNPNNQYASAFGNSQQPQPSSSGGMVWSQASPAYQWGGRN